MRLPNKVTSYKESVLKLLPPILEVISKNDLHIYDVYCLTSDNYKSITEFIDALDCLFALNKITYTNSTEMIHYVA